MKQNNYRPSSQKSISIKGDKVSKVLFVNIHDPVIFQLNNDYIYNKFNQFGKVRKVLIFQKGEITKFFVEFFTVEDSQRAKTKLEGTMLHNNYCKMHIFYSNLSYVDLKNKNSKGKDYSINTQKLEDYGNPFGKFEDVTPIKRTADDFSLFRLQSELMQFSKYKSRTDQKQLDRVINLIRNDQEMGLEKEQIEAKIQKDINNIIDQDDFKGFEKKVQKKVHLEEPKIDIPTEIFGKKPTQKVSLAEVYNLFSNYGNIEKIVLKWENIYVQFSNVQFAIIAKDYLQNIVMSSNILRFSFASRSDIVEKINEYSERLTFDQSFNRFTNIKSISINPPSKVLHISNLKKDVCNTPNLTEFLETVAKVDKLHILTKTEQKNMVLAKFFNMEDSIKVISKLHNSTFGERKIQISFTKSKI